MEEKIIVVCGPTASGKTCVSVELAKILGAEIISADSVQIYKELGIGAAKPTAGEMSGIKHHLIDIISVTSAPFSVAGYVKEADARARDIQSRNKRVIVCGGTGLYIDHFINGTEFSDRGRDAEYRERLEALPGCDLYKMLAETDPGSAEKIHPNNRQRIIRALEIYKLTGMPKSESDRLAYPEKPKYDSIKLALNFSDRGALYEKINGRVDTMLENGLLEEARGLYERGLERDIRRTGAIGYVELLDYFNGLCGFGEAVENIKRHTRNYAKRQLTWFKKDPKTIWVETGAPGGKIVENCLNLLV